MSEEKDTSKKNKITGIQKSAIILLLMSKENSTTVFSSLKEDEVKELSHAMANLGHVNNETIQQISDEFQEEISNKISLVGNLDTTQKLLESVMGPDKVSLILEEIKGPMGRDTWDKLANVNEDLLAAYLKNEHPQTIALVISKINCSTAAKVLSIFSEDLTYEVMVRLLSIDSVKKEILENVENSLRSDFISSISKVQKRDSHELMAEIFNHFDRTNEAKYMGILEEKAPDHALKVKELMFTFDDLVKLKSEDVALLLRKTDKNHLTLALKGANDEIRNLFIDNMSQRASKILIEDMEAAGPVRLKDVDHAQSSILNILKDMIDNEEIIISSDSEEEYIE